MASYHPASVKPLVEPVEVLPPGWEQREDKQSGRIFYVNHETKVTQWNRPEAVVLEVSPPSYDRQLSEGSVKALLDTHTKLEVVRSTVVDNPLLVVLSLAVWSTLPYALLTKTKTGWQVFIICYFLYFGFFVFFAGYFPPCLFKTLLSKMGGGPCIKNAPHVTLAKRFERVEDVSQYMAQLPTTQASLVLHVRCSHAETRGSGEEEWTVTITTFKSSKTFDTSGVVDSSDNPHDWMRAIYIISTNIFHLNYNFDYEMDSQTAQLALNNALEDYQQEHSHRDKTCTTWCEMKLGCGKTEEALFSKEFFCLPRFFLNRCTLGLFSYASLLLPYLIVFNLMCKPITYHCRKTFSVSQGTLV